MNNKRGFTLIELMVVMAILAILLAIGAGAFGTSLRRGRDNTRKTNLKAIANSLELYYNDKGAYPIGASGMFSSCYTVAGAGPGICGSANPVFKDTTATTTIYMPKFPVDPISTQRYYYVSNATGTQYQLYAYVENNQDQSIDSTITAKGYNCALSGTVICNYGVSSGNINP